MNLEIKKRWIEALKSGDYKQGTGFLHKEDYFCCLGVLCDLAIEDEVIRPWIADTDQEYKGAFYLKDGVDTYRGLLPLSVAEWAGINVHADYYPKEETTEGGSALWNDNDTGKTFLEIAEIIKEYF